MNNYLFTDTKYINNLDIEKLIYILNHVFPDFYYKYNRLCRDAISFYYSGHCTSFARILYAIFNENVSFFAYNSHVITKIGNNYYDIRGCVNNIIKIEDYQEYSKEEFGFLEQELDKLDDYSIEIEKELITFGKKKLKELKIIHNENLIRKLTTKINR